MSSIFERSGAVDFPFAREVVLVAAEEAMRNISGMKVTQVNRLAGHISVSFGATAFTWGERVTISILALSDHTSRLAIESGTKMYSYASHSKNGKNIQRIITETNKVLERKGTAIASQLGLDGPIETLSSQASSPADEIKKLAELRDAGILSDEEFTAKKKQILGL